MQIDRILHARQQAETLLVRINAVVTRYKCEPAILQRSKETVALRRVSMDLTRALEEMRKA